MTTDTITAARSARAEARNVALMKYANACECLAEDIEDSIHQMMRRRPPIAPDRLADNVAHLGALRNNAEDARDEMMCGPRCGYITVAEMTRARHWCVWYRPLLLR